MNIKGKLRKDYSLSKEGITVAKNNCEEITNRLFEIFRKLIARRSLPAARNKALRNLTTGNSF